MPPTSKAHQEAVSASEQGRKNTAVSDLSRTGKARRSYLAWEEMRRNLSEFMQQERQALKQHKSVRDIHKARKNYMTSILRRKITMTKTIKKLEWHYSPFQGGEEWIDEPIKGYLKYCITKYNDEDRYNLYINSSLKRFEKDLRDAQYIAQSDFETKIEACLAQGE